MKEREDKTFEERFDEEFPRDHDLFIAGKVATKTFFRKEILKILDELEVEEKDKVLGYSNERGFNGCVIGYNTAIKEINKKARQLRRKYK